MSDTTALISACLIMMSLYITFQLGIECEREKFDQDNHDSANHDDFE